jgi:hypothetical protein
MTDPNSGWGIGSDTFYTIAYATDHLQIDITSSGSWVWSRRPSGATNDTMVAVGELTPTSDGLFGMLCDSGDQAMVGGVVGTDGSWKFVSVENNNLTVLKSGDPGTLTIPVGQSSVVAVECAGTSTGKLRLQMWLAGDGLVAMYEQDQGPISFDAAGVYAEATSDAYSVALTHAVAFGVGTGDGQMSSDAQALLTHIPSDWQSTCFESPVPPVYGGFAQTLATCFLGQPGHTGAEVAEYAQYDDVDHMNSAYQQRVSAFSIPSPADSCPNGVGEQGYSISGVHTGRVLCALQTVGGRFDWTDERLNILSTLIDLDGSFSDLFTDWNVAGPNP